MTFLTSANLWIIPCRKDVAGVSVPNRFYNLLAIGRPVVLISEPKAEAARIDELLRCSNLSEQ